MDDIAAFFVERVGADTWAVKLSGPDGEKTVMITRDRIAAMVVAPLLEATYKDGFEAGLVAQRYFPAEIRAFGYLPAV